MNTLCLTLAIATGLTQAPVDSCENKVRLADAFTQAAQLLAERSKNPLAQELATDLKEHAVVTSPSSGDRRGLRMTVLRAAPSKGKAFQLVVVSTADLKRNADWQDVVSDQTIASCTPQGNLAVYGDLIAGASPLYVGQVAQHELLHHRHYSDAKTAPKTPEEKNKEEVAAYTYEFSLVQAAAGREYRRLLQDEVERIRKDVKEDSQGIDYPSMAPVKLYAKRLEKIYGKARNETEQKEELTSIWINALFVYFDTYQTEGALEWKMRVVEKINSH